MKYPLIFRFIDDEIIDLDFLISEKKYSFNNILLFTGRKFSKNIAKIVISKNIKSRVELEDSSSESLNSAIFKCISHRPDLLVAVGGGGVVDVLKRTSLILNIPCIVIPTLISNDGLISPISVIINATTKIKDSLPSTMPFGVIIHLPTILDSPVNHLISAAGDILTNLSATNDWVISKEDTGEVINDFSYNLSRNTAKLLLSSHYSNKDLRGREFLQLLVSGQVNSGIAMSFSGNSRPCSGSEHLISHAIDYLDLSNQSHGMQVASVSLFSLYLQNEEVKDVISYLNRIGLNYTQSNFYNAKSTSLKEIFKISRIVRKERYTVLNRYTDDELMEKYWSYLAEFIH
jgi:glycerol-1-phosphate dehydrogenase [NAD(P)+]